MFGDDEEEAENEQPVPSVDIPSVETDVPAVDEPGDGVETAAPEAEDIVDADAPAELQRDFWTLVIVADAALMALAVGLLFLVFRDNTPLGATLLVAAAGLCFYARERYRSARETDWEAKDA